MKSGTSILLSHVHNSAMLYVKLCIYDTAAAII